MAFQKGQKRAPRKAATAKVAEVVAEQPTDSVDQTTAPVKLAEKKKRVPVGLRSPMAVHENLDPSYKYRFVRDKGSRIEQFLEGGYEMVTGDPRIGDPSINKASSMGAAFSVPAGDNEDRVFLMRIPKEFYEEDQAAKQAKVDEIEGQLKRRPRDAGLEGEIKGI